MLSTHTLPEARLLCERLIVLASGAIVYDGPTGDMALAGSGTRRVRLRVQGGDEEALSALVAEGGGRIVRASSRPGACDAVADLKGDGAVAALARRLVLAGWAVEAIEPLSDALEDAFRQAVRAQDERSGDTPGPGPR
jgi:ABC-type multidrug transport system ATPase subunit